MQFEETIKGYISLLNHYGYSRVEKHLDNDCLIFQKFWDWDLLDYGIVKIYSHKISMVGYSEVTIPIRVTLERHSSIHRMFFDDMSCLDELEAMLMVVSTLDYYLD